MLAGIDFLFRARPPPASGDFPLESPVFPASVGPVFLASVGSVFLASGGPVFFASVGSAFRRTNASAPAPAITFNDTATSCVLSSPHAGTNVKSVRKHPAAAPAVFTAYSSAIRRVCASRSARTR